jgi:PAS domain S-box-containing protein
MSEIPEELIEQAARDERHRQILRELGLSSYMVVPLVVRGRTLGVIIFAMAESRRRYEQTDLEVAEDLARRAAVAIDNARLYEEAQKVSEVRARLAAIVESSDDAIISKTLDGIITSWNLGAQKIYGYSAEEVIGKPIDILVPPEYPNEIPQILERLRRGEAINHYETVRVTKDGRRLDISLSVSPIRDSAGVILGASAIARDITERKRVEEALREVREAERKRMARDLHDGALQDLTYAVGEAQLARMLSEDNELDERLEQMVSALECAVQGVREAIYDLRLQEERDRPFRESLEALLEISRQRNPGCNIRLDLEGQVRLSSLGESGVELLRIIQEALNNVRRHSGAENVLISLRIEGNQLVAEIEDDGRGFDPNTTQARIGQKSMSERVAALDGELEVQSEPGKGTRVRVRAPLSVANGERGERG